MSTLILLPGMDGTGELFAPFIDAMAASSPQISYRVISYPRDQFLSLDDLTARVSGLLEGEDRVVILAESFSGPIALRLASLHPKKVLGVVLCCSFVAPPMPKWIGNIAALALRIPAMKLGVRIFLVGLRAPSQLVNRVVETINGVDRRVIADRLRAVMELDAREALSKCPAPILYLRARQDRIVPNCCLMEMLQLQPRMQVAELDGPHLLLQTTPELAQRHIFNFCAGAQLR